MTKLAVIYSRAKRGLDAPLVCVETHISNGLPKLSIVGLAETEVQESKDRVRSAIINSGFEFPPRRITINLAPADLPKESGRFDLPIAIGILLASEQIKPINIELYEFAGELALSGQLRAVKGVLPLALAARRNKRHLIIPTENVFEATMPQDNIVYAATNLKEVCMHIENKILLSKSVFSLPIVNTKSCLLDMQDIQGQQHAKRALEIAAAGRHSILLIGAPGTGKSMLASRLPTIMPDLTTDEALEVSAVYSLINTQVNMQEWRHRPFRSPHHTISSIAMVGGGSNPVPGEISLAHHGVLFLDELPEFDRKVLEVLREPLETGLIAISRVKNKLIFPAQFQLVAAMNPCPCGLLGNKLNSCSCSHAQILRYQSKVSAPLLDRIDIHIEVPLLDANILTENVTTDNEKSLMIKLRVQHASELQYKRQQKSNNLLSNNEIKSICMLNKESKTTIKKAIETLHLSARSFYRILKVARTIADLDNSVNIQTPHLKEALSYRSRIS